MSTDIDLRGDVPQWTLADRLVKARGHRDLSQRDVAAALGISLRTVNRYESGEPAKRGIILGWALACGVDPTWLEKGTAASGDNGPDGGTRLTAPDTGRYAPTFALRRAS